MVAWTLVAFRKSDIKREADDGEHKRYPWQHCRSFQLSADEALWSFFSMSLVKRFAP